MICCHLWLNHTDCQCIHNYSKRKKERKKERKKDKKKKKKKKKKERKKGKKERKERKKTLNAVMNLSRAVREFEQLRFYDPYPYKNYVIEAAPDPSIL